MKFIFKKSIYKNLFFSMLGFGMFIGIIFPPFAKIMLGTEKALSFSFFILCICAGLIVGGFNYFLFNIVVSKQLSRLTNGMQEIINRSKDTSTIFSECDSFSLTIDSDDNIGRLANYFNEMSSAVCNRIHIESHLKNISSKIAKTIEITEMAKIILEDIIHLSKSNIGALYGLQGEKMHLLAIIGIDKSEEIPSTIDKSYGAVYLALNTNQIIDITIDESGFSWVKFSTPFGTLKPGRIKIIPFSIESRVIAVAFLTSPNVQISEINKQLIESIRLNTSHYLNNAILHNRIKMLAAIDELTQLLNRRFGIKRLNEEFSRSIRHGIPLSVIMLDIDYFKQINDNFGHETGDEVLTCVAKNLEKGLRASDVVCRYGGEEFLIIVPGAGISEAGKIADRIRLNIEKLHIKIGDREFKITVSCGVATWPGSKSSNGLELISDADRALYFAKNHGRNQVVLFNGATFQKFG
ncbi:MAG: GGDEF domain-containing protein [Deltaproteobacteria bacterium]|nr:GGDEF domain-containing protein [Deltaproteobacteria bacterium]